MSRLGEVRWRYRTSTPMVTPPSSSCSITGPRCWRAGSGPGQGINMNTSASWPEQGWKGHLVRRGGKTTNFVGRYLDEPKNSVLYQDLSVETGVLM